MKTLIKYLVVLACVFSINCFAQQPGDRHGIADKNTYKGKRELRREMKIKHRSEKNADRQERRAIRHSPIKHYTVGKHKKIRLRKNKEYKAGYTPGEGETKEKRKGKG